MNVTMLLADSAQVADGKLFILGGGWSVTGPDPTPSAVAMKIDVDSPDFLKNHHWELFLEDADGRPVVIDSPDGPQPVEVRGQFQVGTPEGLPPGTSVDVPIAINFGPIPLAPASRYMWRLVIDGNHPAGGHVSFTTRPPREN